MNNAYRIFTRMTARRRMVAPPLLLLATTLLVSSAGDGLNATPLAGRRCDFNSDGFEDLAIGVPGENVGAIVNTGAVNVIYGSASGLTAAGDQVWHQDQPSVQGVAETGDAFGATVVCGNFNLDQYDDLAIGVPGEDVGGKVDAGAVVILFGSASGLTAAGSEIWHQDSGGVLGVAQAGDRFGAALAAGDFDDDLADDLAVGVPGENIDSSSNDSGAVNVLFGGSSGLTAQGNQYWTENSPSVPSTAIKDEMFGAALAAGDFNNDGFDDLAIGIPGEDLPQSGGSNANDGGAVIVLKGSYSGLVATFQFWSQDNLDGVHEDGDAFGYSLAAGDFDNDGFDDLAVGVPGEDVGSVRSAGAVNVIYGSANLLSSSGNQIWHQDSAAIAGIAGTGDAFGAALAAGDLNGDGADDLAIGVPSEDIDGAPDAGAVVVLLGSAAGLSASESQFLHQDAAYIEGVAETADAFGSSVGVGDFNGDGMRDLVAGVPGEAVDGVAGAGAVNVLYGADWGASGAGDQIWHQGVAGINGVLEQRDRMASPFPTSDGIYRLPYANGTSVYVSGDLFTHSPDLYEYDIYGTGNNDGEYTVVAAADGVIMMIEDSNVEPPDKSNDSNNQVWIAHPNGEWTKYTHLKTGSVEEQGLEVGDLVSAGTVIGIEGDVGQASREHVHFQVTVPDNPPNREGQTRVPLICGIPGNIMYAGRTYTAGPC